MDSLVHIIWPLHGRWAGHGLGFTIRQQQRLSRLHPRGAFRNRSLLTKRWPPGYDRSTFYPAYPGQILDGRFELKAKIGWGSSSTVWLAKDVSWKSTLKSNKYAALKITTSDTPRDGEVNHEVAMAERLGSAKGQHRGRAIVCIPHEAFVVESPTTGLSHLCLVFEPLRDPLWLLRRRLCGDRVTRDWLPMFKVFIQILLEGLDYLHSECKVVHTDLKLDNIMMTFEDQSVIERFVQGQKEHPMARKLVGDHAIYRCHNNFGDIADHTALKKMYPKLTDFGLAQPVDQSSPLLHPIQPDYSHAPEVLLGTSWSYPTDMWNLGTMIWDLLSGRQIFQRDARNSEPYDPEKHLADMIALLGPMPELLIERERAMREVKWTPQVRNAKGRLCDNAAEYFGGPFLTNEGEFVRKDMIPPSRNLESETPDCIPAEDRDRFLSFLKRMLAWLPEDRATAKELKDDPWFDVKL